MDSPEGHRLVSPLAHRIGAHADAAQIADALVATWQDIASTLKPIIGQGGVSALYKRSLHITSSTHPWLDGTHEGIHSVMDLDALRAVFLQQTSAAAAAGGSALFKTFHELLTSLVGPSLTERLLRSVWTNSSSGSPPQDIAP